MAPFNSPVTLGWSRNREAPRSPSEPWITPQTQRLHFREILVISLTPLFSLCRRQPLLIHLRPNHGQQLLKATAVTSLPNLAFRQIYDKTLSVGTLQYTQLVIRARTGVRSVSVTDPVLAYDFYWLQYHFPKH